MDIETNFGPGTRSPVLVISTDDLDKETLNKLEAAKRGERVLGGANEARMLFDSLPSAIARRVRKIVPEGFVVAEIQLELELAGSLLGMELGGKVLVALRPYAEGKA